MINCFLHSFFLPRFFALLPLVWDILAQNHMWRIYFRVDEHLHKDLPDRNMVGLMPALSHLLGRSFQCEFVDLSAVFRNS